MVIRRSISWFLLLFCMCAGFISERISNAAGDYRVCCTAYDSAVEEWYAAKCFAAVPDRRNEAFGNARECLTGEPAAPVTAAKSAVVMDVASRRVLYKKNPHVKLPMASTTKIMTAILAIEMGDLADVVTVSPGGRSRGFVYLPGEG